MTGAEQADALRAGGLAILPTDTVYGVACSAALRPATEHLYALKERPMSQPTAIMLGSVGVLLAEVLPDADGRTAGLLAQVLPGPVTLIVANPAHRYPHVCGDAPDLIGVRVPTLTPAVAALADAVGGLVITSANLRGEPAPARLADVPRELIDAAAIVVDGGELPGTASSVIDVTGPDPVVLRDGPGVETVLAAVR